MWLSYMSLWWSSVCQPAYTVTSQLTLKYPDMFAYMYCNGPIYAISAQSLSLCVYHASPLHAVTVPYYPSACTMTTKHLYDSTAYISLYTPWDHFTLWRTNVPQSHTLWRSRNCCNSPEYVRMYVSWQPT